MRNVVLPVLALLLAAALPTRAEDEKKQGDTKQYEVKITRPLKVGQKYKLTADGALLRQVTLRAEGQEKKQPEEGFGVRLEGTVEVLAVDDVGEESKVSCTVEKCTRISPEGETELLPKGKVLIAEGQKKDTKFTLQDGTPLAEGASEALELVISLDTGDTLTDDDLFGTREKKAVGDTWPVAPEAVSKDAERVGVVVRPGDVDGLFKLDGMEKAEGVDCLRLSGSLKMKKLTRRADENDDDSGLPEGFVVTGGSMEARYSGLFPVDASVGSLAESVSMTFVTDIKGKAGPGNTQDVTVRNRVQRAGEMKRKFLD
jgi:hypothetical protein